MRKTLLLLGLSSALSALGCSTGSTTTTGDGGTSGSSSGTSGSSSGTSGSSSGTSGSSSGGLNCSIQSGGCECSATGTANTARCSKQAVPGSNCCAEQGWPTQGRCSCKLPCTTGGTCACGRDVGGTVATCDGKLCCQRTDSCVCQGDLGVTECDFGNTRVATCTGYPVGCDSNETPVDSCSASP